MLGVLSELELVLYRVPIYRENREKSGNLVDREKSG